ncbi:MAG: hypothetical protein KAS26_08855 [Sulfurimonas sp.]|nr:hypothetical protein [Sulfurimonas sp.]
MLNDVLLQKLKLYFKSNLENPSIDFRWTNEDNIKLFAYLNKNFADQNILDNKNRLTIEHAFREYFEPVGTLLFKISQDQIRLKVVPYKTEPKDSINLDALIDIMEENEHLIQENYNFKKDLICIQKELTQELNHFIESINNEEINKKELLKFTIKEAFELNDSDIIIIKNNQIFIKLFDDKKIDKVADDKKETVANRFNGIDEDRLNSFYKEFFIKEENKDFFYFVAEEFVNMYFVDKQINNATYEKYAFSLIQSITKDHLVKSFDNSDEFFKGFSGYVFRIHFKEVFGYIANFILAEISASNQYMMEFLKYYSLNIVVQNGKKYKVPEIEADNGLKWNVASMISIVKIYIKTEISLEIMKDVVDELEEDIRKLYIGGHSPVEYNNGLNKEILKISQTISHDMKKLNIYLDTIDSLKDKDEKTILANDVREIKEGIHILQEDKEKLISNIIKPSTITQYSNLKKEIDSIRRQETRDKKILIQNKDGYLSIKNSLVKALTSKKVLVGIIK